MIPEHTTQDDRRQTLLKSACVSWFKLTEYMYMEPDLGSLNPDQGRHRGIVRIGPSQNSSPGTDQHIATALWGLVARVYSNRNLLYWATAARPCRKSAQGGWIKPTKCVYIV